ncbi:MAG: type VI secretion system-associated FHA domain protein TagH [Vicinamibacterales bacterium]
MTLTLEITNPEGLAVGAEPKKVFRARGGTIGREADKDWYLPHPSVSRTHAVIRYQQGSYTIEDARSSNGVIVNSGDRLTPGVPYALSHGDVIIIEPFEIHVTLAPAGGLDASLVPPVESDTGQNEFFSDAVLKRPAPPAPDQYRGNVLDEQVRVPAVAPVEERNPFQIPTNWNVGTPSPVETPSPRQQAPPPQPPPSPTPTPDRPPPKAPPSGQLLDLAEVLRAAGLDAPVVAPDIADDFGRILRIVVEGLMEVLRARQRLQAEFRIQGTTYKPRENNPLKFSVDAQDALHNLLVKRHPGYLGAVDAFENAFDDIHDHEVAMLSGIRAAFESILARFDPAALQQEFDRQMKKGALVAVPAKLRYWELYSAKIRDMVRDPEVSFRDLFGDEFASAYEEQLKQLKAGRRGGSS